MRIPKYWTRRNAAREIEGEKIELVSVGWSFESISEAGEKALEILERMFSAIQYGAKRDAYLYSDRPIKEETISEFSDGEFEAIITRTTYGSLVLNCNSIMFIDIDNPRIALWDLLKYKVKLLLGQKIESPMDLWKLDTLENVKKACQLFGFKIRMYSTFKGFRGLIVNKAYRAETAEATEILNHLKSDKLYIKLCKVQDCFRARLTPKPFRCGYSIPKIKFPYETQEHIQSHADWVMEYDRISEDYSTCKFIGEYGEGRALEGISKIAKLHDKVTKAGEPLALA